MRVAVDGVAGPTVTLALYGPGDCAGMATTAILRREPTPSAVGVSPSGFAIVEFSAADLPWRLTPTAPTGGQLMPWLALVVVPASAPFERSDPRTLPVVTVDASELPPIASVPTWAHVQLEWDGGTASVSDTLRAHPERARSRLVAARRLAPRTRYRACVVPTYEAGRRAGLGQASSEAGTGLAWHDGATTVRLPVYDAWEFETGDDADFETLARDLRPVDATTWATARALDVSAVGGATPATRHGFLRPPGATATLPDAVTIAAHLEAAMTGTDLAGAPVVGPPRYGDLTTGHTPLADEPTATTARPSWSDQLNHDPRTRMFAAVGANVVRRRQDELVDELQRQLGDATRADQLQRGGELAALLSERLHARHVASCPPSRALEAFARGTTARRPLVDTTEPAWRRMRRALGPLARGRTTSGPVMARIGADLSPDPGTPRVTGLATLRSAEAAIRALRPPPPRPPRPLPRPPRPRPGVDPDPTWPGADEPDPGPPPPLSTQQVVEIRAALAARAARNPSLFTPPRVAVLDVRAAAQSLFSLDAARPVRALINALIVTSGTPPDRSTRPAPSATLGLIEEIAASDSAMFLPTIDRMPPSTVSLLELDRAAVAAALVGANHELVRELAWRRLRFDPRATMVRKLWRRGDDLAPAIGSWTGPLGESLTSCATVLVVRSELMRRFPDALFALAPAIADRKRRRVPGDALRLPVFRFSLAADVTCVGFAAPVSELRRELGSYLIVQETVGATRFGLDAKASPDTSGWINLPWSAVMADPYLRLDRPPQGTWPPAPAWNGGAAAMATITERPAVRLAIHLDELVP